MSLPAIVKEISKTDKNFKTFLVNCHPYVITAVGSGAAGGPGSNVGQI